MQWHNLALDFSAGPASILPGPIGFSRPARFLITFLSLGTTKVIHEKKESTEMVVGIDILFITEISYELYQ